MPSNIKLGRRVRPGAGHVRKILIDPRERFRTYEILHHDKIKRVALKRRQGQGFVVEICHRRRSSSGSRPNDDLKNILPECAAHLTDRRGIAAGRLSNCAVFLTKMYGWPARVARAHASNYQTSKMFADCECLPLRTDCRFVIAGMR